MDEATFAADFLHLWEPTPLASSTTSTRSTGRQAPLPRRPGLMAGVEEDTTDPLRRLTTEGTRSIVTMLDGVGKQFMVMVRGGGVSWAGCIGCFELCFELCFWEVFLGCVWGCASRGVLTNVVGV